MSKQRRYIQRGVQVVRSRNAIWQFILAGLTAFMIADDVTIIGVLDWVLSLVTVGGLQGLIMKAAMSRQTGLGRTIVKSLLTIATGGMILDDITIAGLLDNWLALICALILAFMGYRDIQRER